MKIIEIVDEKEETDGIWLKNILMHKADEKSDESDEVEGKSCWVCQKIWKRRKRWGIGSWMRKLLIWQVLCWGFTRYEEDSWKSGVLGWMAPIFGARESAEIISAFKKTKKYKYYGKSRK